MRRRPSERGKIGDDQPRVRTYELQHREDALLDLMHSYPSEVMRGLALRQEAEWHFGRLYLIGAINQEQYSAARYLDKVTREYESMLRRYGNLSAVNPERTSGNSQEDLSQSAQKKFARAKRRYEDLYEVLDECGEDTKRAVVEALRRDAKTNLKLLQRGLTILAAWILRGHPVTRGGIRDE